MTAPPSPASSEMSSCCCSMADEGLQDGTHSEASSPELKRARRQNMRTKLEDILNSRHYSDSPIETGVEIVSNVMQDYTSKTSYKSVDNRDFEVSHESSHQGLGNAHNFCCSLPDMNLVAANECKGIAIDCCCCSHSVSEPTEISLELRSDRGRKVVSSYYSHFKQIRSSPLQGNDQSKVESDDGEVAEGNGHCLPNEATDPYWKDMVSIGACESDAVILNDFEPTVVTSLQTAATGGSPNEVGRDGRNPCGCGDDYIAVPTAICDMNQEDGTNTNGMDSMNGSLSGDENVINSVQTEDLRHLNTSAGENTGIEALSPIIPVCRNSIVSPAGESLNKMETIYENSSCRNVGYNTLETPKHENILEKSEELQNDSGQLLCNRIETEFKSELEFSTILTLAYVRVRDLTNNIDKAQEYLTNIDLDDDDEDIDELRYKIQAMFDNRANFSLEQVKWRTQFSAHFQQRKKVLSSLKSRACRTEQTYFQLRKELLEMEKEQIIPKRKRSLFLKIFSFGFVK